MLVVVTSSVVEEYLVVFDQASLLKSYVAMSGLDEVVGEVFSSKMCSYGNMKLKDLLAF